MSLLIWITVALFVADIVSTKIALKRGHTEGMALTAWMIDTLKGFWPLARYGLNVVVMLTLIWAYNDAPIVSGIAWGVMCFVYALVVISNVAIIRRD